jgi:hypothetical protein
VKVSGPVPDGSTHPPGDTQRQYGASDPRDAPHADGVSAPPTEPQTGREATGPELYKGQPRFVIGAVHGYAWGGTIWTWGIRDRAYGYRVIREFASRSVRGELKAQHMCDRLNRGEF